MTILFGLGCSGREKGVAVEPPKPLDYVKEALSEIAASGTPLIDDTGEMNSRGALIQEQLETRRETDAAKADDLLADFNKLISLRDSSGLPPHCVTRIFDGLSPSCITPFS